MCHGEFGSITTASKEQLCGWGGGACILLLSDRQVSKGDERIQASAKGKEMSVATDTHHYNQCWDQAGMSHVKQQKTRLDDAHI
mmetsp:Transcript_115052/g.200219  ORF Transcript_115052/g.200219 Transcript_115052/m.200219 type:complete len:84 (+) Transcript_115052:335-586(+)